MVGFLRRSWDGSVKKKIRKRSFFFLALIVISIGFIGEKFSSSVFAVTIDPKVSSQFIPYFASIKAKKVNMRSGPSRQYPIVVILTPQPVEVIGALETWLQIQTCGGKNGWIQKNMVSTKKRLGITKQDTVLSSVTNPKVPIAQVQKGALGQILHCDGKTSCHISFGDMTGSLPQDHIYGIHKGETLK